MQRKIEFRGKHIYTQEWYFGCLLEGEDNIFIRDKVRHEEHGYLTHPVIPETVGQFTGCFDKNGTEIYEGDQLHICAGYSSVVEFQDAMFVSVYSHPEDGETIPLLDVIEYADAHVIGNIYDNPELLNK